MERRLSAIFFPLLFTCRFVWENFIVIDESSKMRSNRTYVTTIGQPPMEGTWQNLINAGLFFVFFCLFFVCFFLFVFLFFFFCFFLAVFPALVCDVFFFFSLLLLFSVLFLFGFPILLFFGVSEPSFFFVFCFLFLFFSFCFCFSFFVFVFHFLF